MGICDPIALPPPRVSVLPSLCVSHHRDAFVPHISSKASCNTSTKWFLTPALITACHAYAITISRLHPRKETGMRAASSGCPTSWHLGRAAPVQPPAWLSLGGSEYILLLSHWLPEERLWRGRGKRREMSQKDHSRLSASSGNILNSHQRDCLPCSTVAVLPAKTTLDAIEYYCCKTQSWTGPWEIS